MCWRCYSLLRWTTTKVGLSHLNSQHGSGSLSLTISLFFYLHNDPNILTGLGRNLVPWALINGDFMKWTRCCADWRHIPGFANSSTEQKTCHATQIGKTTRPKVTARRCLTDSRCTGGCVVKITGQGFWSHGLILQINQTDFESVMNVMDYPTIF